MAFRRFRAGVRTTAAVAALLLTLLFPTTRFEWPIQRGCIALVEPVEFIVFAPFWGTEGRDPDVFGLSLELGLAIALGAGVWALYPALRPSRAS